MADDMVHPLIEADHIQFRVYLPPVFFETEKQAKDWIKATLSGAKVVEQHRNQFDYGANDLRSVAIVQRKRLIVKWE